MKKGIIYIALIILAATIVSFVIIKEHKKEESYLPLKERSPKLARAADWPGVKAKADDLFKKVNTLPADSKSKLALASLYMQEARVTGDHLYYDKAAMGLVNGVLRMDSVNFEALAFKSMIYLSEHHFSDGMVYARKARQCNPYNSFVYGLLVDANVELGNYKEAVAMTDKMVSIRPDLRSYSRVSYLREIYGDYPGAIDAMKLAVSAGYPGAEETEWCRIQLGHLYENSGKPEDALMQYKIALYERPDYAYAYAGMGRLAKSGKKYRAAIDYFTKADSIVEDYSFKDELIDLYALDGQTDKSKELTKQVLDKLTADAASGANDNSIGHYADKELAYVYIKTGNYDKALEHAQMEYNRRPDNIDVNEALAWSYYKKGDIKNAVIYIAVALKTNSQNPILLSRSALIYNKAGDTAKAKALMHEATGSKAYITPDLADEMAKTISRNAS